MASNQTTPGPTWSDSDNSHNTAVAKEHQEQVERPTSAGSTGISAQPHPIRRKLGLKEQPPIHENHDEVPQNELLWSRVRITLKEPFAEFFGTFIMVFFGNGSVAQVLLSAGLKTAPGADGYGQYQSISWG